MLKNREDLFVGRFPGCLVFADRTVNEHGDYKTVAHVTYDGGNIRYFADIDRYPAWVKECIEKEAGKNRAEFLARFESEVGTEYGSRRWYERIIDSLPMREYLDWTKIRENFGTLEEKCRYLLPAYMARN